MKNLTDEQIIIALECCAKQISNCSQCSYRFNEDDKFDCEEALGRDTIDLINRKNAKIEELKAEIERMENQNTLLLKKKCKDINTARKITKSEAIKEFAERLKEIIYTHANRVDVDGVVLLTRIDNIIDNLVTEMMEEEK